MHACELFEEESRRKRVIQCDNSLHMQRPSSFEICGKDFMKTNAP